ncbi:sigma-70 family RNA polymerase sigma factor [Rhizorhapis sp. SPR117]|uniref:sigma-70 family RNA polymerase sigma factor n=1 Tax=Rhizorhapis sp. SPR117 TaxID=2912611 RepID=UPI001F00D334|nr:sigma-70 family RNA polymerase sigma factor [Rhizorhapis sp. SPR117]
MRKKQPFNVARHLPSLYRYARLLTRDENVAEELVQDTLVAALAGSHTFDRSRSLRGWLFAILHNRFISDRRKAVVRTKALAEIETGDAASPPNQEVALYLQQIQQIFNALPDDQRAALHLVVVEGLRYREAAEALGIPIGTLMSRIARARARLRDPAGIPRLRVVNSEAV